MGTPDKPGPYRDGDPENSPDAYTVMYKLKSSEQMFRVAPDTGGSTGMAGWSGAGWGMQASEQCMMLYEWLTHRPAPPDTHPPTHAFAEFGPEFIVGSVNAVPSQGKKLATWQIVALSMFWWGFALWMYMFVVLMIPGQVRRGCPARVTQETPPAARPSMLRRFASRAHRLLLSVCILIAAHAPPPPLPPLPRYSGRRHCPQP
jgi:hypothetical protein